VTGRLAAAAELVRGLPVLVRAGVVNPRRPDHVARQLLNLRRHGATLAGGFASAAVRAPDRTAVVDETEQPTYAEMAERTTAIASGMAALGVRDEDAVAVLAPNGVPFVEALVATSRLGADAVLLSTFLSAEQIERVLARERTRLLVVSPDLLDRVGEAPPGCTVVTTRPVAGGRTSLAELAHAGGGRLPAATRRGRLVVLTSGTTGTPRAARRPAPRTLGPVAAMLSGIPLRAGDTVLLASPLFHTWALGMLQLAPALAATTVLCARPEPATVLDALDRHRCTALVTVPVVLDRLLQLPPEVRAARDTSALRVVVTSGAALHGDLVERTHAAFGDVLHNLYGSTEISWGTIAGPRDLREVPGTVGRAPLGTRLAILDDDGTPLPAGRVGAVYVGNSLLFDGYTDGGDRPRRDGLVATGDRGSLDPQGRLLLAGRADGMINTGGEKVHPEEVERALAAMPDVADVAVRGWPDPEMGEQVVAYVVPVPGATPDATAVRDWARARLARYAVPRSVVLMPELPRTPTGKVVPRLLPAPGPPARTAAPRQPGPQPANDPHHPPEEGDRT
jgi:acyl-CoA synthetase (AMP-forming)/AMP-acid ligase II